MAEELLNVYDARGRVVGARARRAAKASGQAVGAVNALVIDGRGRVLLQRRLPGKDNGGLWDKTVGGHVSAGEEFDATAVREAGEELFDDGRSESVRLFPARDALAAALPSLDL
ncbi:MAG TPA: NUDIX domain-containing protein, partial [Vicinamibacteria bacterium]|nr:NUDIX domain-containing protein [Vicinamibacteria bacterium]